MVYRSRRVAAEASAMAPSSGMVAETWLLPERIILQGSGAATWSVPQHSLVAVEMSAVTGQEAGPATAMPEYVVTPVDLTVERVHCTVDDVRAV